MDALLSTFKFCFVAAFEKYDVFKAEFEILLFTMQDDFGKTNRNLHQTNRDNDPNAYASLSKFTFCYVPAFEKSKVFKAELASTFLF